MLKPSSNPLFKVATETDLKSLETLNCVHRRKLNTARRELRDCRRSETAKHAIAGLDKETEIFGFTKGQFSLLDLLAATISITGPVHVTVSTWTAAQYEIQQLSTWLQTGRITGMRILIDFSMARREPATTSQLREAVGHENVRVAQTHAKFALFQNENWKIVLRTSMNLNMNPRYEDFQIAHDPELADFINNILDVIWTTQKKTMADKKPYEIVKHFRDEM